MADKKKSHGGLKVLLSLLFIILLSMFSTCFAIETGQMTFEQGKYLFDYFLTTEYSTNTKYNGYELTTSSNVPTWMINTNKIDLYNQVYNNTKIQNFVNAFNNADSQYNNSLGVEHYLFFAISYSNNNNFMISCLPINNTIGNNLPHLSLTLNFYGNSTTGSGVNANPWKIIKIDTTDDEDYSNYKNLVFQITSNNITTYNFNFSLPMYFSNMFANSDFFYNYNNSDTAYYSNYQMTSINNTYFYGLSNINSVGDSTNATQPYILKSFYDNTPIPEPEPEQPSEDTGTGIITNPSGEVTGQIDLSGIENGLVDIKDTISGEAQSIRDTISGETGKVINTLTDVPDLSNTQISGDDITFALGFNFIADPYDNFWLQMTTGLSGALTNSVRKIPVNWLGYNGYFDLDELDFNYPEPIRNILTAVSTVSMVWLLVKWWKIIIDKLTSGDVDEVLAMNDEERYN